MVVIKATADAHGLTSSSYNNDCVEENMVV